MPDLGMSVLRKSWLSYTEVFRLPLRLTLLSGSGVPVEMNPGRMAMGSCAPLYLPPSAVLGLQVSLSPQVTGFLCFPQHCFLFLKAFKHRAAGPGTLGPSSTDGSRITAASQSPKLVLDGGQRGRHL